MLLEDKNAWVVGATGAIGEAVARRLAEEGATLHLFARSEGPLFALAKELGARARALDATNESAVDAAFGEALEASGCPDLVFTAVGPRADEHGYGRPVDALHGADVLRTLEVVAVSQFLVARAAARPMTARGRGAIVTLSATLSAQFVPLMSGITAACSAVEGLTRSLAAELGPRGVRVNCVRAGGIPDTRTIRETFAAIARTTGMTDGGGSTNLLRRPLDRAELAHVVAWLGSDRASGIDGQIINVCHGSVVSR